MNSPMDYMAAAELAGSGRIVHPEEHPLKRWTITAGTANTLYAHRRGTARRLPGFAAVSIRAALAIWRRLDNRWALPLSPSVEYYEPCARLAGRP